MAEHKIVITLTDNIHAVPTPQKSIAHVGDTLRYETDPPGIPFIVEVPGSPFTDAPVLVIGDREPRPLVQEGRFFWRCFLRRPSDNQLVGWFYGEEPESGGDVDVRP